MFLVIDDVIMLCIYFVSMWKFFIFFFKFNKDYVYDLLVEGCVLSISYIFVLREFNKKNVIRKKRKERRRRGDESGGESSRGCWVEN